MCSLTNIGCESEKGVCKTVLKNRRGKHRWKTMWKMGWNVMWRTGVNDVMKDYVNIRCESQRDKKCPCNGLRWLRHGGLTCPQYGPKISQNDPNMAWDAPKMALAPKIAPDVTRWFQNSPRWLQNGLIPRWLENAPTQHEFLHEFLHSSCMNPAWKPHGPANPAWMPHESCKNPAKILHESRMNPAWIMHESRMNPAWTPHESPHEHRMEHRMNPAWTPHESCMNHPVNPAWITPWITARNPHRKTQKTNGNPSHDRIPHE